MITDKPMFGHGISSFDRKYMQYQSAYFEENTDSEFITVADNAAYAYNEFIHITVESGILGLLFLTLMFCFIFMAEKLICQKSSFAALLAFSMFSYPSGVFPLLFLFPLIAGCINSKPVRQINLPRIILFILSILLLCGLYLNLKSELYFRNASCQLRQIEKNNSKIDEETNNYVLQHYKRLKYYPEFCKTYAIWLSNNFSENGLFNALELFPSSENYCFFGELYLENGIYGKAETCFKTAASMTPNRILPNYCLFRLYKKYDNKEKAILTAKKILSQPVKIENTQTIKIKFEVENYLKSIE
jgi:hypothetical protein